MRKVYTIGETVLDIMFRNQVPVSAKAGGSMLNASVTLGRLHVPVHFISEYGSDEVGEMVNDFLSQNGVDTTYIYRYKDGKSAIALAFLDENQNAAYSFYKLYPQKRLDIGMPPAGKDDIVMFGSYFGIAPEVRGTLMKILTAAKENGAIILYDPNFRKAHLHQLNELIPVIRENFRMADIVKGSDEDFRNIFNAETGAEAFEKLGDNSKVLIYTTGRNGAELFCRDKRLSLPAKMIEPLSTIGAGDNFSAGIAYGLLKYRVLRQDIPDFPEISWRNILNCGNDFAAEVCLSYDNYISERFAREYTI